jgi:cytochrome c2
LPHAERQRGSARWTNTGRHLRPQDRDPAGYDFSPALKKLDIVWTADTLSKLFEVGPATYTPGTKMPEQRVGADDRAALVKFLEKATRR